MNNKELSKKLEERTKRFAISTIKLSASLPGSVEKKVARSQISKACTSIDANYREANRSRIKSDFRNKIAICESESGKTSYRLEIIGEMNWIERQKLNSIHLEANELLAIFRSIGKNLKI